MAKKPPIKRDLIALMRVRGLCGIDVLRGLHAYSNNEGKENHWPWPNFTPEEFACRCGCGEAYIDRKAFDEIQYLRELMKMPLKINCAHRCVKHNEAVGGAPKSQHLKIAFDVSVRGWTAKQLTFFNGLLDTTDFYSRGCYATFVHIDMRRDCRYWLVDGCDRVSKYIKRSPGPTRAVV